mmetsp:Transcript_34841/g.25165  ORF Transcript_34841/g.25165 Transcript_34841/m.25165 type:complete len:115 (-) Transcript_34841:415-759(-)
MNGLAVYKWKKSGSQFCGIWKDDKRNGLGQDTYASGAIVKAHYLEGVPCGYTEYYWPDGNIYKGFFMDNKKHGIAKFFTAKDKEWTNRIYENDELIKELTEEEVNGINDGKVVA